MKLWQVSLRLPPRARERKARLWHYIVHADTHEDAVAIARDVLQPPETARKDAVRAALVSVREFVGRSYLQGITTE